VQTEASDGQTPVPMVAMLCGKNTQHIDLSSGEWITDGNVDCMHQPEEILKYCQKVGSRSMSH